MTDGGLAVAEKGVSRRRFLGYLIAAPTLVAAAELTASSRRTAAVPTTQPVDLYDLTDLLTDAAPADGEPDPSTVNADGTASFALPRAEVGQGITTAVAMMIAEELDLPVDKVTVTLADARPELVWNQLTGGSNTMHSIYTPVRVAAAIARGALLEAAAIELGRDRAQLTAKDGVITAPDGQDGDVRRAGGEGGGVEDRGGRARSSSALAVQGRRHAAAAASTRSTSSPGASSSRWTSTSRTRCRRWSAGRRRSTARRASVRNLGAGPGDAGRSPTWR